MAVKVKSLFISWRTIALALLLSVAAGLSSIAEPIDRIIESAVGRVAWRPVSGDIVIVALDDKTLERMGKNDFSMAQHARVVDGVNRAGAKRLFVDFLFDRRGADRDFPKMTAAIRRMGSRAVLAVEAKSADLGDSQLTRFPSPAFGTAAQLACIGWEYEFWQVWRLPTALNVNGRDIPTFSSLLANVRNPKVGTYALDLSYNTDTIKTYSAIDVISGQVGARELAGKDVIFAATATAYQDTHYLPGHDKIPGAFIHLIGGETLKRGQPIDIGWIPALALTAAALIGALAFRRTRHFNWIAVATGLGLIVVKVALMPMLVTVSIGASLFLIATISTNVARTSRRKSAQHENPVSGLPNFEALRTQAAYGSATVIAAKVVNFEDLAAFIPGEGLSKLVEQVTRRLQLASQGTTLYHDLDGTFAWLVPYYQHSQIETQLMGLAALFNAPLTIDELKVDVSMAFGVNDEFEGSNAQRLAAALVAAEKSIRSRVLWTKYTPQQKDDAGWQLSFHSQLEDALNAGDIWVAFQPQYRIATRQLVGVEALVRWTHPTRGPISPDEFIVQAEKSQDIYRLTLFVMDQAIRSAAQLQKLGTEIHMSVNLSATLLDHKDLVSTIRVMLSAHHLSPERLTIEITETAQIENSLQARQTLAQIRRAGMRLSIDDYGTGQSNLEYLTEIEADEIKIDKRFVMTMRDSQRNLEVVKSTIDLAHRLGATAVAEGIEDAQTMALLDQLGCDIGQGYLLGKPQLIGDLLASLSPPSDSRRA
ncbi:EAL domain-containing protein [Sphingopyxis terrae]|uniref:Diguanylate phosphodiesterase n=1 Tax=Sphingopyxis terrae subsp. ummariensis TaxID=429001 RepID=A0A1Y6EPM1_9SPHN|nr:EAL domain-containing protein [Sphingopyxis terrae]PCF92462.1 diguanylate phosphodiesterase [Sphingopyxis terrae subsp. ummariensis]SMQ64286.1 diguanylate phosphodiesterase [Sphingopyxis terrae subsp. ummariensis]